MRWTYVGVTALATSVLVACAPAPDSAPDGRPGWTGMTEPDEVIEARRVLMIDTERQMLPIDTFIGGGPADPDELRARATTLEAMLLALPHLFPPTTDLHDSTVLEPPTRALPAIWQNFDAFLALAEAAEVAAGTMAAADGIAALRAAATDLRDTCDGCHAAFARPYVPPQVTPEDLDFDFTPFLPDN